MLPLRGAGLGAPPGADMVIEADTDGWEVQAMAQRSGRTMVVFERLVKDRGDSITELQSN